MAFVDVPDYLMETGTILVKTVNVRAHAKLRRPEDAPTRQSVACCALDVAYTPTFQIFEIHGEL